MSKRDEQRQVAFFPDEDLEKKLREECARRGLDPGRRGKGNGRGVVAEDALRHYLGIEKRDDPDLAQDSRTWRILRARDAQAAWAWLSLGRITGKDATLRGLLLALGQIRALGFRAQSQADAASKTGSRAARGGKTVSRVRKET